MPAPEGTPARSRRCSSSRTSRSPASVLAQALEVDRRTVEGLCERLARELEDRGSGLVLRNIAGGWRLVHPPGHRADRRAVRLVLAASAPDQGLARDARRSSRTSSPSPGIRSRAIRGVNSDGVLRALTDRGLIEEAGREETPGRPVLYGTTPGFLERLGLPSLASLPSLAPLLGIDAEETPEERRPPDLDDVVAVDLPARRGGRGGPRAPALRRRHRLTPCPWSASSARWPAQASVRVERASS